MAVKRYLARIFRPRHIQQKVLFKGKLIGCTETAACMWLSAVTFGASIWTEKQMRAASSEPIPNPASPGLNLDQIRNIMVKLRVAYENRTGKGDSWTDVIARLNENRRVQISVWIGVNHSEVLQAVRKRPGGVAGWEVLKNNPLSKKEEWVPESTIKAQAEAFVHENNVGAGLSYAYSKILPFVASGAK